MVSEERYRAVARQSKKRRKAWMRASDGHITDAEWDAIKEQFGRVCACCGVKEGPRLAVRAGDAPWFTEDLYEEVELYRDHVIPLSKGGSDAAHNIQPLCSDCNSRKATKTTDYRRATEPK